MSVVKASFDLKTDDIPAFLYLLPEYNKDLVGYPREGNSKITGFIDELLDNNEVKLRQFSWQATISGN